MAKKISYSTRDFAGLREELVNLSKEYYPELVQNTNDASIFSVLLDLNAAIGDNLHYHIDRVWQETMLDFAQQRKSLFHIAKTYGMRIPGNRPSVSLCDLSINVPVRGDKEDERYLGIVRSGNRASPDIDKEHKVTPPFPSFIKPHDPENTKKCHTEGHF